MQPLLCLVLGFEPTSEAAILQIINHYLGKNNKMSALSAEYLVVVLYTIHLRVGISDDRSAFPTPKYDTSFVSLVFLVLTLAVAILDII